MFRPSLFVIIDHSEPLRIPNGYFRMPVELVLIQFFEIYLFWFCNFLFHQNNLLWCTSLTNLCIWVKSQMFQGLLYSLRCFTWTQTERAGADCLKWYICQSNAWRWCNMTCNKIENVTLWASLCLFCCTVLKFRSKSSYDTNNVSFLELTAFNEFLFSLTHSCRSTLQWLLPSYITKNSYKIWVR